MSVCLSVCLSLFANYRWQFLLDRLGRYRKLFVSTLISFSHAFACHFGRANFLHTKNECSVDRQRHVDNLNSDKCSHNSDRFSQIGEKATSQNGDSESLYLHSLKQGTKLGWSCGPSLPELLADHQICYVVVRWSTEYWKLLTINFDNMVQWSTV